MNQGSETVATGDQPTVTPGATEQAPVLNSTTPVTDAPVAVTDAATTPDTAAADHLATAANGIGDGTQTLTDGAQMLPSGVDGTLGDSLQEGVAAGWHAPLADKLVEFMVMGGPVVWILSAFSVVALSIVLLKLWQLVRLRPEATRDVERGLELWRQGEKSAALSQLDARRPVSELVALAMRGVNSNREVELLREELTRLATLRLSQLRAWLRPLEVIATLSPLLGLLGTVLGMIAAFQQMEAAGSQVDPSVLSGGIWQALLTTAVGLVVAIPTMTLHNWLERKVERITMLMNDSVTRVFTGGLAAAASVEAQPAETRMFEHAA